MQKLFILFFALFTWAHSVVGQTNHCIKNRYSQDTFFNLSQIDTLQNIMYGQSNIWPGSGTIDLKMDVYMPDTTIDPLTKRPLVLLIHGGAFLVGNKTDMRYFGNAYAQRGFVAVSIQYQLGWDCPTNNILALCVQCGSKNANLLKAAYRAIQETRGALKYLVTNAANYQIDTSLIFLMGESAGSITALHTAFLNQKEVDTICPNCKPTLGGLDTVNHHLNNAFTIKGVIDHCGAINKLSAIDNNDIPVIGFHDELDCVVPYGNARLINCLGCTAFSFASGSNSIHNKLKSNGVHTQMNTVGLSLGHCSYPKATLAGKSSCFMKSIFCQNQVNLTTRTIGNVPNCDSGYVLSNPEINANELVVYPNPAKQDFSISWNGHHLKNSTIRIMDAKGSLLLSKPFLNNYINVTLNETTAGLKFIFIYNEKNELLAVKKIWIE